MRKSDTNPETQKIFDELYRKLSYENRFKSGLELTSLSRRMFVAGLQARHPQLSGEALRKEILRHLYGIDNGGPALLRRKQGFESR